MKEKLTDTCISLPAEEIFPGDRAHTCSKIVSCSYMDELTTSQWSGQLCYTAYQARSIKASRLIAIVYSSVKQR